MALFGKTKSPTVKFVLKTDQGWETADPYCERPELLLQAYMKPAFWGPEVCEGGFLIKAGFRKWNDVDHLESFYNSQWWLKALVALLETGERQFVWAWEETDLHIWRKEDRIYLEDKTHHSHMRCPKVAFELKAFLEQFLPEAQKLVSIVRGLQTLLGMPPVAEGSSVTTSEGIPPLSEEKFSECLEKFRQFEQEAFGDVFTDPDGSRSGQSPIEKARSMLKVVTAEEHIASYNREDRLFEIRDSLNYSNGGEILSRLKQLYDEEFGA